MGQKRTSLVARREMQLCGMQKLARLGILEAVRGGGDLAGANQRSRAMAAGLAIDPAKRTPRIIGILDDETLTGLPSWLSGVFGCVERRRAEHIRE